MREREREREGEGKSSTERVAVLTRVQSTNQVGGYRGRRACIRDELLRLAACGAYISWEQLSGRSIRCPLLRVDNSSLLVMFG